MQVLILLSFNMNMNQQAENALLMSSLLSNWWKVIYDIHKNGACTEINIYSVHMAALTPRYMIHTVEDKTI